MRIQRKNVISAERRYLLVKRETIGIHVDQTDTLSRSPTTGILSVVYVFANTGQRRAST
jgi:hypothetical protein